jgi:hypothetical protein
MSMLFTRLRNIIFIGVLSALSINVSNGGTFNFLIDPSTSFESRISLTASLTDEDDSSDEDPLFEEEDLNSIDNETQFNIILKALKIIGMTQEDISDDFWFKNIDTAAKLHIIAKYSKSWLCYVFERWKHHKGVGNPTYGLDQDSTALDAFNEEEPINDEYENEEDEDGSLSFEGWSSDEDFYNNRTSSGGV